MDPNANAANSVVNPAPAQAVAPQAPVEQAAPATATEGTTSQTPETNGLSLSEDVQKFLANQNINSNDPAEIISTLVQRNQSLRSNKPADIREAVTGTPAPAPAPATTTPAVNAPLTDLEIATVDMMVKNKCKDVHADSNFYREMKDFGMQVVDNSGRIILDNVMKYANYKQTLIDAENIKAQANNPATIPAPANTVDPMSKQYTNMTKEEAKEIIILSTQQQRYGKPVHSQYEEAVRVLQS